jgi:cytochrome c oxidase subunit 1
MLWRGDIHPTVQMFFALGFIVTFVNGGLTGLFLGNAALDVLSSDTMFVVAHFHIMMGVAPVLVIFGAIYHWYPKVTDRMPNEALGKFHFWVTFIGSYIMFFPLHYLGLVGIPRRYYTIGEMTSLPLSTGELNQLVSIAAFIVGFGQLVFMFNMVWSLRNGAVAGGNPWRVTTLQWETPETPPG